MPSDVFWKIDNVEMPCPSSFEWGIQSVSSGESGRTEDGLMHVNLVTRKRKIAIGFNGVTMDVASQVLQAVQPEYFDVYYFDPLENGYVTKTFYVGDRSAPFKTFWVGNKRIDRLSFDIIER